MLYTNFVHLHVHSHYSLLDGAAQVKDIVAAAKKFRMPAVCITDHGNMYAAIELYHEAEKKGLKPIMGFEAYITTGPRTDRSKKYRTHHLVLLAKNKTGYENLLKLASIGFTEGFYYKPRIDYEYLEKHSEGIIALSACLAGEIPRALAQNDFDAAKKKVYEYKELFDEFYIELQDHGIELQKQINPLLVKLAKETNTPLVATNDVHYINQSDAKAHDVLLCIGTKANLAEPDRMRFPNDQFYLKSEKEMRDIFADIPEAIDNTQEIVDKCNFEFVYGNYHIPKFKILFFCFKKFLK